MRTNLIATIAGLAMILGLAATPVAAQRIIIDPIRVPPGPHPIPPHFRPVPPHRNIALHVKKHTVDVSITDGVAVTNLDQVFSNPYAFPIEGTYIFPLADDVALSKFSMFVNGQEVEGKLLGVEEARRMYESIVSRMRDPALLEYIGTRMFRARIFPIQPKGEARVRLSYTQMLKTDNGLVRYRYPLNTVRHTPTPIGTVGVRVQIASRVPIKSVFSPSHKLAVSRSSNSQATASWEGNNVRPDKDFELYYTLSDKEFGLTVLTHRQAGEDGFFLARIAPPAAVRSEDILAKDITFVIDTSGSMSGEKIEQARAALRFCLQNLNPMDRFNIIPFAHEPVLFRDALTAATKDNVSQAKAFVDKLRADGGTNINDALIAALDMSDDGDRPYLVVFLTDGLPTIGVSDHEQILRNVADRNTRRVRLFAFGVGHDVNTKLLDLLAEQNRGARDYVEPGEDLELKLSSFYRKVADPVLADLSLSFGGLDVYDLYPPTLGDLFSGTELVVAGRYRGDGPKAVELTGTRRKTKERFVYETSFPSQSSKNEFLPRLWAARKVGFLLDEMRLHGENSELKDAVVKLATTYGIVTPYTAYLVTEPGSVASSGGLRSNVLAQAMEAASPADTTRRDTRYARPARKMRRARGMFSGVKSRLESLGYVGTPTDTGRGAVALSISSNELKEADAADEANGMFMFDADDASNRAEKKERKLIRRVAVRTFYRIGEKWVDSTFDAASKTKPREVELFSKEYFDLIRKHPELAKCFALGERVVVVIDKVVYETVPPATNDGN